MAAQRPTAPLYGVDNMNNWLAELQAAAETKYPDDPSKAAYVHPKVLTWVDGTQKRDWAAYLEDAPRRDIFGKATRAGRRGHNNVAVFIMDFPNASYVNHSLSQEDRDAGVRQWEKPPFYCTAGAIIRVEAAGGGGKVLLLYDPAQTLDGVDKDGKPKPMDLGGLKRQRLRYAVNGFETGLGGTQFKAMYITNSGEENLADDKCVDRSTAWVERWAMMEAKPVAGHEQLDERFSNYRRIGRSGSI
ncbi:hypothetical protein MBLNU230_g1327t1 [Neophaeotheca triangularis]